MHANAIRNKVKTRSHIGKCAENVHYAEDEEAEDEEQDMKEVRSTKLTRLDAQLLALGSHNWALIYEQCIYISGIYIYICLQYIYMYILAYILLLAL